MNSADVHRLGYGDGYGRWFCRTKPSSPIVDSERIRPAGQRICACALCYLCRVISQIGGYAVSHIRSQPKNLGVEL
jgi:hypothetical protein